jgi:transposase
VPPEPIRQPRDLTRTRSNLTHERTREYSRLEKGLEDSNIKLSAVASTLGTRSARSILDALISGERDPQTLASLVHASMRRKTAALVEALTGRFTDHHAFMARLHLDRIDQIEATLAALDARIDTVMEPFSLARELLMTVPGISKNVANVIIAEAGIDMNVFHTAGHLASWAGVSGPERVGWTN